MTWITAFLAAGTVVLLPATFIFVWRAVADMPSDSTFWIALVIALAIHGCLIWAAIVRIRREARAPGTPLEPSELLITEHELKIERVGGDRGVDVSWGLSEINDIRICNAAPDRAFGGFKSIMAHAVSHDEVIRVSVERPTGEVDDVMILSTGRYWASELETRLRAHLRLSPDAK